MRFLLTCDDHRARAAAVRVVRYTGHQVKDQTALLTQAAQDEHGRVRLEAITAASWLKKADGLAVFEAANTEPGGKKAAEVEPAVKVSGDGAVIRVMHPAGKSGRVSSVKMTLPGGKRTINLSELQVLAGTKNITGSVSFSSSSVMGAYGLNNLVDGNRENFFHTEFEANPWFEISFSKPVAFSEIKIWNRQGFTDRFANARVEYFQGGKKVAQTQVDLGGSAGAGPMLSDSWTKGPYSTALARLNNEEVAEDVHQIVAPKHLKKGDAALFVKGAEIYEREGFCGTCHQPDGEGLVSAGFPPLAGSRWVTEQDERLIKLTLKGLMGPIEVKGKSYPGLVPMTPFEGMLNDEEMAAVLTYVRNSFGNKAGAISPSQVKAVRAADKGKQGFYSPAELLKAHPNP